MPNDVTDLIKEARAHKAYAQVFPEKYSLESLIERLADALEVAESLNKDYLDIAKTVEARMQAKLEAATADTKRWMKDCLSNEDGVLLLQRQLETATAQNAKLTECLIWYADATRYACGSECCEDNGKRARAALEAK